MIWQKIKKEPVLQIILLIAAAMRFYNYSKWSLSNDERSEERRVGKECRL